MLRLEYRQMYSANGLIDDFVLFGSQLDYLKFSQMVESAINSLSPVELELRDDSDIRIVIYHDEEKNVLFTSLQNQEDFYLTMQDWHERDQLKIIGSSRILKALASFLENIAQYETGYSYISEFSETYEYSSGSPQWRLHTESLLPASSSLQH